jgi:hypothetical protein
MHPLLLSSEFDPFQVAIIVIAVLGGFVKWLWENWQQTQGTAPPPLPNPEEQRLREAAWRKQTGQTSAAPPPPPRQPPVIAPSPWEELRKAWNELQEVAKPSPPPAPLAQPRTPPPLRQQQPQRQAQPQRQPARTPAPASRPAPAVAVAAPPPPVAAAIPAPVVAPTTALPGASVLANLRQLRRDPALMRQAILLQEILGPPKALQSSRDLAI